MMMEYRERTYRNFILNNNLISYQVTVRETDLFISTDVELSQVALQSVHRYRSYLENYIAVHPEFLESLIPVKEDILAPDIVRKMMQASQSVGVGPMAAVAGAIAQCVGEDLLGRSANVIVENGGDIFLKNNKEVKVGIYAGKSPLSNRLSLRIRPEEMPLGICTSSASVGPSLSLGAADAVCIKSKSAFVADAGATAIGNLVKTKKDIDKAISFGSKLRDILGILIIMDDQLGVWGDMAL